MTDRTDVPADVQADIADPDTVINVRDTDDLEVLSEIEDPPEDDE